MGNEKQPPQTVPAGENRISYSDFSISGYSFPRMQRMSCIRGRLTFYLYEINRQMFVCQILAELLLIAQEAVSHDVLIRWDKQALLQLLSTQSQKNQHLINQITTLSLCSCTKRLLLFLYEMAKDNLTMGRMDIPVQIFISNKDIASIINTSREHVTKMLRSLEKTMRIKASGNKIVYYPVDVEKKLFWSV